MNILEQCKNYESSESGWFSFQSKGDQATGAIYARESVSGKREKGKTVVAVLGLAHCNGIKQILEKNRN